jgi:uncharacterized protein YbjT (DUF2867 family)
MSLLVFNSSNRIAQGVVKRLYGAGSFEKIVCADVYPTYQSVQRFLDFKSQLNPEANTSITDIKISEKTDLANAINRASHVLYITHDYYTLTASKLNLIKTTAELAKKNKSLKKFVALTPTEHDHYGEANPAEAATSSERDASKIYPELVHLKSDLTFGPDSTVAHSIITRFVNGAGLSYSAGASGVNTRPIHTDDVASAVETALNNDSLRGSSFLLQGPTSVTLAEYIKTLQAHVGRDDLLTQGLLEKILSPAHGNLLTERLYDPSYSNLVRLLAKYKPLSQEGFENINNLGLELKELRATHAPRGYNTEAHRNRESFADRWVKSLLG